MEATLRKEVAHAPCNVVGVEAGVPEHEAGHPHVVRLFAVGHAVADARVDHADETSGEELLDVKRLVRGAALDITGEDRLAVHLCLTRKKNLTQVAKYHV